MKVREHVYTYDGDMRRWACSMGIILAVVWADQAVQIGHSLSIGIAGMCYATTSPAWREKKTRVYLKYRLSAEADRVVRGRPVPDPGRSWQNERLPDRRNRLLLGLEGQRRPVDRHGATFHAGLLNVDPGCFSTFRTAGRHPETDAGAVATLWN